MGKYAKTCSPTPSTHAIKEKFESISLIPKSVLYRIKKGNEEEHSKSLTIIWMTDTRRNRLEGEGKELDLCSHKGWGN